MIDPVPNIQNMSKNKDTQSRLRAAESLIGVIPNYCKICSMPNNDFVVLNETAEYSGIEIAVNRQGILRVRYSSHGSKGFDTQDTVNIDYCPICGSPFKHNELRS